MQNRLAPLVLAAALLMLAPTAAADPLDKVESALLDLRADRSAATGLRQAARDSVWVDVYVSGDAGAAASGLRAAGLRVEATTNRPYRIVEGTLPVSSIDEVAELSWVRAVAPVRPGGTDAGSVTSQGDAAHRGPEARLEGPTGAGIAVGVISDSIGRVAGGVQDSQDSGDLPASVNVLKEGPTTAQGAVDEGRAMAEIIYDGAPGISSIAFASGTLGGVAGKADSIGQLVASGVRIIADDIFYLDEPFFEDGTVADAVDAARAAGVTYLASAGNRARQSYEAAYADSGSSGRHDFDPGSGVDTAQTLGTVPDGGELDVIFQWDERWGGAETNLDVFLRRVDDNVLEAQSISNNLATGLPREVIAWENDNLTDEAVYLEIRRVAGSRAPFMKYIFRDNFSPAPVPEYNTASDAINPDAASANGALTVAAVRHNTPNLNVPEPFSSRGLKVRLFDTSGNRLPAPETRQKPNIAAADGVATTVPGFDCVPASQCFSGTSAAVPSAAGIAALMLSAKPSNTADDVYAILQEPANALDCTLAGQPDADCGVGFVLADRAVGRASDSTPPVVAAALSPARPNGRNGFYRRGPVSVTWSASDDGSPITSVSGCDPVTIAGDTAAAGTTLTCTARSAGGSGSGSVTIKRDATAPRIRRIAVRRRGTLFRFRLSEAASARLAIQRRRGGRFRRARGFKAKGKQGRNRVRRGRRRPLAAGRYRLKLTVTDRAGNRKSEFKRFRVR